MNSGKLVTFSERIATYYVVANLSAGPHKRDLWFTQNELHQFKANFRGRVEVVRYLLSSKSKLTPRAGDLLGMEKQLTPALTEEYVRRRDRHVGGVLRVARRPGAGGEPVPDPDVDRLARTSAESSRWAVERARVAALFLEQDQEDEGRQRPRRPIEACDREEARRRRQSRRETMEPRGEVPSVGCWC